MVPSAVRWNAALASPRKIPTEPVPKNMAIITFSRNGSTYRSLNTAAGRGPAR